MEQKLSDMLTEAKAGGPPPRYSADDVVEAGRRLKRRRRVQVWAGAAAALVVVAVGVTVPRFGGPEPMPAAPVLNTISYPAGEFAGNLIGFSAEGWTVSGTTMVTPAYEVAVISRPDDVGRVVVFRPGAFDATEARGAWEAVPVNDRPGFYRDGTLAWEYAQDAWAVVTIEGRAQPSREQVAAVAAGVQTGAEQPMRVGVKFGYVPAGYRLASAGEAPSQDGQSGLLLLKSETPFSYRYKAGDPIEAFPMGDRSLPKIQVAGRRGHDLSRAHRCRPVRRCGQRRTAQLGEAADVARGHLRRHHRPGDLVRGAGCGQLGQACWRYAYPLDRGCLRSVRDPLRAGRARRAAGRR